MGKSMNKNTIKRIGEAVVTIGAVLVGNSGVDSQPLCQLQ